ncbi:NUDIX hydrolase [Brevibacillus composti]|uniref:NUDIX hydrolase n=1 Tax=Brevibacillus composti TaxID=2796470 RepID=A0A7T5JMX7_9BACL|nr:NUDIX hydrolase [Brevibacillus composti]QQE73486.1 NUDIX hydrolase [Brevibacillus composti]QUO40568.1 NUDIX hydrolase [Brevibacillus composti]
MKRVDVAYTLLYDEPKNQVLLVYNRRGDWSLPGGGVEQGETLAEAAVREMKEETGYEVEVTRIIAVNEAFLRGEHVHFFTFHGRIVHAPDVIPADAAILDVKWVDVEEADRLLPYYPEGVSGLIRAPGAAYVWQGRSD